MGIGICGSFVTTKISQAAQTLINSGLTDAIPPALLSDIKANIENIFLPEVQALLSDNARTILQEAIAKGVSVVFWIALIAALICFGLCLLLPEGKATKQMTACDEPSGRELRAERLSRVEQKRQTVFFP